MANQSLSNFQKRFAAIQERLHTMEELQKMRDEAEQKIQIQRDIAKVRKQLEEQQKIKDERERKEREEEEDARKERRETYRLRRELRNPVKDKDPLLERPLVKDPTKIEKERQMAEEFLQGKKPSVPKKEQPVSPKEELRKQQLELLEKARQEAGEPDEEYEEAKPEPKVEAPKLSKEEQLKLLEEAEKEVTEPAKPKGLISIKEERQMVEEFMKQKGVDQSEVEELLKDPALVEQPPPGGWKCMNQGHEDRPAVMKIRHNEVLGEGMPILTFCKDCAAKFKMTPIMENNPSKAILRSLSSLAIQLDKKGLYEEANAIDALIEKLASNAGWRQVQQGDGEEEGSEEQEEKPGKKRWPKKKKEAPPVIPQKPKITCVTQGHTDRPAVVQMTHSGILGEELPPLNFCEDCALRVKMIPIGGKPSLITKRFSSRIAADPKQPMERPVLEEERGIDERKHPYIPEKVKDYEEPKKQPLSEEAKQIALKHKLLKVYGPQYKDLLTPKVLSNLLGIFGRVDIGAGMPSTMSELLDRHMKALLFKDRLSKGKCISCGEETEPSYLEKGEDVVGQPVCQQCMSRGLSPEAEKFLEGMGLKSELQTFMEEPMDPREMTERFSYPEDEESTASLNNVLVKMAELASHLDNKGLYDEANALDKLAVDMSPQEYEKYYGKPMDRERLEMWKSIHQPEEKEPEGIIDLFQGPDKEKLEERLDESMKPQAPFAGSRKSLVSILNGLRSNASSFGMRLSGVWLNPNNVAVMLNAPNDLQLDSFLDAVEHYLGGTMANLPAQEFAHILSDGLVVVYDRTNKNALQTLKSYPGVDVVIGFMHWEKLDTNQQEEFQEVIENLFAKRI